MARGAAYVERKVGECFQWKARGQCSNGDSCRCSCDTIATDKNVRKTKKGGAEGPVAILKESAQLGFVSQDSYPRKSIQREERKLGSQHAVKFSKGTWHRIKIREIT